MRTDGTFEIYQIEQRGYKSFGSHEDYWYNVSEKAGFTASEPCWQQTGIHGTFDEDKAHKALLAMRRKHLRGRFRLIKRTFSRTTEVVSTMSEGKPYTVEDILAHAQEQHQRRGDDIYFDNEMVPVLNQIGLDPCRFGGFSLAEVKKACGKCVRVTA